MVVRKVETSTALISLVLNVGVSVRELALAADIDPRVIETPTLLPYEEGIRLWQAAEALAGDPSVGLRAGMLCTVDRVPVLGTLFGHSDDLGDALGRLERLLPSVIRHAPISFTRDADGGTFTYRSPSTARHGVDAMFAGILQIARHCADHSIEPRGVTFQSPRPSEPARYERFFGVRPRWNEPSSSMRFDAADLTRPFRGAAPALARVLETSAPALIGPEEPQGAGAHGLVEEAVHRCIGRGVGPSISEVAAELGKSPRTLQRMLAEAGSTFRDVRDEVRRARGSARPRGITQHQLHRGPPRLQLAHQLREGLPSMVRRQPRSRTCACSRRGSAP